MFWGFISIFFISCSCDHDFNTYLDCLENYPSSPQFDEDYLSFYNSFQKWRCLSIDSYRIVYRQSNMICPDTEITLLIEENKIVESSSSIGPFSSISFCEIGSMEILFTLDNIFNQIEIAADENIEFFLPVFEEPILKADRILVVYDERFFFPKSVYIDYDRGIADEEFSLEVIEFEKL